MIENIINKNSNILYQNFSSNKIDKKENKNSNNKNNKNDSQILIEEISNNLDKNTIEKNSKKYIIF